MHNHLKISIALCTYNGEKYLPQQLDSILHQSVMPDELVICDDVSSDDSIKILEKYRHLYPTRIKLFRNEVNLGYTKNFEKAISLCTGDLIFLSDQDDVWRSDKMEKFVQIFQDRANVGLVYSDADVVDENLNPVGYSIFQSRTEYDLSKPRSISQIIHNVDIKGCLTAFKAEYKSLLLPIDTFWTHDHWITLILHAISEVKVIDECLMNYRRHNINFGKDSFLYSRNTRKRPDIESRAAKERRIAGYTLDNQKVEAMHSKLTDIKEHFSTYVTDESKLETYIQVYQHLLHSLVPARQKRAEVLKSTGASRFKEALKLLSDKTYFHHFKGVSSFIKDVLAGW